MTYYTPPDLRREVESFDVVPANPPFRADYATGRGKTHPARILIEVLRNRLRSAVEKLYR